MKQEMLCSRSTFIRLVSFIAAAAVTAAGFAFSAACSAKKAQTAETALSYTYRRAVTDLADHVDGIDTALEKTLCSGTDEGVTIHAARVWRESAAAKACLASLPTADGRLDQTARFLSQVGEYAYSLANRASAGEAITQDERDTLIKLSGYASDLREQLSGMLADMADEGYTADNALRAFDGTEDPSGPMTQMEGSYEDYPTLIYDGPFSDHLTSGPGEWLRTKPLLTVEQAEAAADKLTGGKIRTCIGKRDGAIPVYLFEENDRTLELTEQGGVVLLYSDSRPVAETHHTADEAVAAAAAVLRDHGLWNMIDTYTLEMDNTLLVNFAFLAGDTVCYPDLIKVTVSLDDLSVVGFEAAGYLANHKTRTLPDGLLPIATAQKNVSPFLTVDGSRTAVICPGGLTEYFVYEFRCLSQTGREVLVYIDATTGREVDLLLLLDTPGGTLTV